MSTFYQDPEEEVTNSEGEGTSAETVADRGVIDKVDDTPLRRPQGGEMDTPDSEE
jgi:hypothetical protein